MRSFGAVVLGLAVAFGLVFGTEMICTIFHPWPPGADPHDPEVCAAQVRSYPHWVLGLAVLGWGLTTFASAWIATRLGAGRHVAHGLGVGAFLLLAAAFNILSLPYPLWFGIVNLVVLPLGVVLGCWWGRCRPVATGDS